jgi:hypothetical protein
MVVVDEPIAVDDVIAVHTGHGSRSSTHVAGHSAPVTPAPMVQVPAEPGIMHHGRSANRAIPRTSREDAAT